MFGPLIKKVIGDVILEIVLIVWIQQNKFEYGKYTLNENDNKLNQIR